MSHAQEVSEVLSGDDFTALLSAMYGNQPEVWSDALTGFERWRLILNYFTRMRFCTQQGRLDLKAKEGLNSAPKALLHGLNGLAPIWLNRCYLAIGPL